MLSRSRRRLLSAAVLLVSGMLIAWATWLGGAGLAPVLVVIAVYALVAAGAFLWSSRHRGGIAALLGTDRDEREQMIGVRAFALSGLTMAGFSVVMALIAIANQAEDNPWLIVCLVGAVSYALALGVLRLRS